MTGETATRVLLADDQDLVRAGLRMIVDSAPDLTVVAEAATGRQAIKLARQARADVVLMDIRMPDIDGLAATRQITADDSLAGVKILILTTFEVDEYVFEALRSGASGFLGKGSRPEVLVEAIRTVARGDALLSPTATRGLITRFLSTADPTLPDYQGRRPRAAGCFARPRGKASPGWKRAAWSCACWRAATVSLSCLSAWVTVARIQAARACSQSPRARSVPARSAVWRMSW